MVNALLVILVSIPRLFRDFTNAICHRLNASLQSMLDLMSRAQKLRKTLQEWYTNYIEAGASSNSNSILCNGYFKIKVLFYICSIYSNRFNTCIYWTGTPGIVDLEGETQSFAERIMALHSSDVHLDLQSALLVAQKIPIAEAIVASREDWKQEMDLGKNEGKLFRMPERAFTRWCNLFGRKTS